MEERLSKVYTQTNHTVREGRAMSWTGVMATVGILYVDV